MDFRHAKIARALRRLETGGQLNLEIYHLPAHVLAKKIQEKEISSLEVTETFIERIEKYDYKINAVVVKTF